MNASNLRSTITWPHTTSGRVSVGFGSAFAAMFVWVMLLDPLVGLAVGAETTGLTDSWVTPLLMVGFVDVAAVAGVVAWWRGERAAIAQIVLWASVALGALWTVIVVGSFLGDR